MHRYSDPYGDRSPGAGSVGVVDRPSTSPARLGHVDAIQTIDAPLSGRFARAGLPEAVAFPPAPPKRLASPDTMQWMLRHQLLLADRTHHPVAWIFASCDSAEHQKQVADVLRRRMRETDLLGQAPLELLAPSQSSSNTLLVILPVTDKAGVRWLTQDVLRRFPAGERPGLAVHCYTPEASEDESAKRREGFDDRIGGGDGDPPSAIEQPPEGLGDEFADAHTAARFADADFSPFVRKLPLWKRSIDIAVASVGLLLTGPFLLVVGLLIRLDSPGSAFYLQPRAGLGGKRFNIYKLRTMVADADARKQDLAHLNEQDGAAFKLRRDPRVTRLGSLLRSTSLDELPQLLNILRGDMTLVGPRPLPVSESDNCSAWQRRRLEVTPGLTCIWQVHGRSRVSFDDWMRMDLRYVAKSGGTFGWVQDVSLMLKTVPALFLKRGY